MKNKMEVEAAQPVENKEAQNVKEETCEAGGLAENKSSDTVVESVRKTDEKETAPAEESDVYAYTRREEFTSENFKIELRGLPRYFHVGQLKKLLNETLDLNAHKVKPAGKAKCWAYITFRDEAGRGKALAALQGYKWKNCVLKVSKAKPVEDPLIKIREEKETAKNKDDPNSNLPITERVLKSVIPYASLPYEEQLEKKQKDALQVLRKYGSELAHVNPGLAKFISFQKMRRKGQVCEVDDIVPSPVINHYRNKCEFTIGVNPDNGLPTVGFRIASYKEGSMHVAPVSHMCHLPEQMIMVVKEFETFVRDSGLAPFSPLTHEGYWRQLNVRTTQNKDILIIPMIHPQDMNEEQLLGLKNRIVTHFTTGPGEPLGITSIYFKAYGQKEKGSEPVLECLWGQEYITEKILGKNFRVSPDAFLQINTAAAEVLYEKIGTLAELDDKSILLDICCGTGTIGISLADRCQKVYGVEIVEKAADDARQNAKENGFENVAVFTGKAEENMPFLMQHCTKSNTVGVVDPPRAGLNNSVVLSLRRCETMKRLVFVSCDPSNAIRNFISLARPQSKQYKGEIFIPIRAIPVDLFPHTPHFELVILFERWDELRWKHIMEGNPLPQDEEYFKRLPDKPNFTGNDSEKIKRASQEQEDDTRKKMKPE